MGVIVPRRVFWFIINIFLFILIGFILQLFSLLWKRVCVCARVCLSACEFPLLDAGGSSQESSLLFFAYR